MKRSKAFWLVGYAILMLMVGTNLPTPLYGVYEHLWGFSSGILTLIFAIYAIMIIPSLLLFGQLSDRFGRKKVLIPGLLVAAAGSVLFAAARDVAWLFIARAVQGLAVGIVSGAGTAALAELHPRGDRKQAALIASVSTAAGTALGPMLAGILAQYGPWTALPFVVHLILVLPAIVGLVLIPETVRERSTARWKPQRPGVPRELRMPFMIGSATAFIAWAVTALYMSLVPSYISALLHVRNLVVAGGVVFLMLSVSSAVQVAFKRLPHNVSQIVGSILLVVGLAGIVLAVPTHSTVLMVVATLVVGAGQGLAFMGSMALVSQLAPTGRSGNVIASFYVVIYCGVGLPILGIGFGAVWLGLYHAVLIFTCLVTILAAVFVALMAVKRQWMAAPGS